MCSHLVGSPILSRDGTAWCNHSDTSPPDFFREHDPRPESCEGKLAAGQQGSMMLVAHHSLLQSTNGHKPSMPLIDTVRASLTTLRE